MPCDSSHMNYGYNADDWKYGKDYYLHPKREQIRKAGGVFAAIEAGIISPDDGAVRRSMKDKDVLSALLCWVMCELQKSHPATYGSVLTVNPILDRWWSAHQEEDREQQAKILMCKQDAEARDAAMQKLTPQEKALLGLNR